MVLLSFILLRPVRSLCLLFFAECLHVCVVYRGLLVGVLEIVGGSLDAVGLTCLRDLLAEGKGVGRQLLGELGRIYVRGGERICDLGLWLLGGIGLLLCLFLRTLIDCFGLFPLISSSILGLRLLCRFLHIGDLLCLFSACHFFLIEGTPPFSII